MEKQVKEDILAVFDKVLVALLQRDATAIAELSNHTIHNASVYQDEFSLTCAVVVYALSKVIARCEGDAKVCVQPIKVMQEARAAIDNDEAFAKALQKVLMVLRRIDEKMHLYIEEVIHKARVKKGSALHKHGISLARAAELLGVTLWDLQNYVGQTVYIDEERARTHVKQKMTLMRTLFP